MLPVRLNSVWHLSFSFSLPFDIFAHFNLSCLFSKHERLQTRMTASGIQME